MAFVQRAPALAIVLLLLSAGTLSADSTVCVISWADDAYMERRAQSNPPQVERYVVMQGRRFQSFTRDDSLERRSFIDVARTIAAQLVHAKFEPAPDVGTADLLLLVHWGTTRPRVSIDSLRGTITPGPQREEPHAPDEVFQNHPENDTASQFFVDDTERYRAYAFEQAERVADGLRDDLTNASNANLLGYTAQLRRLSRLPITSTTEQSMRGDLEQERYFIIVKAFDLKSAQGTGKAPKPVWTLHMNTRSPGQNFRTALANMSKVAADFAGTSNPDLKAINPRIPSGEVEIGELQVIGVVQ